MDFWILWNEYSWHIAQVGMQYDMEQGSALVIGTGCMPNCNFAMINAKEGMVCYCSYIFIIYLLAVLDCNYAICRAYTIFMQYV